MPITHTYTHTHKRTRIRRSCEQGDHEARGHECQDRRRDHLHRKRKPQIHCSLHGGR